MSQARLSGLRLGPLLAEGGEGRVFEVLGGPYELATRSVYKQLRQPRPASELAALVAFPSRLASTAPGLSARLLSSSAWPVSSVVGDDPEVALGTVMPRAPAEFWLRHRDGTSRLATLSYLATDPDRIAVAYGALMPPPGAAERVALVYALARFLEAWQSRPPLPSGVHGDLSAKNVLWSLKPAPAVYVLDCDGASVRASFDATTAEATTAAVSTSDVSTAEATSPRATSPSEARSCATTPNWDDPALPRGAAPTEASDRYVLGITFLRVVGAAHFPLQARQRSGEQVNVDLELPRSWRKLPDMPVLWELCERSLSLADVGGRPSPSEWTAELEHVLELLSATRLASAVRDAQGDSVPAISGPGRAAVPRPVGAVVKGEAEPLPRTVARDVIVRPVLRRRAPSTWQLISASGPPLAAPGELGPGGRGATGGSWWSGTGPGANGPMTLRQMVRRVLATWGRAHWLAVSWARAPGRRSYGLRRLASLLVLDLAAACVVLFIVGMLVSPWIGL